MNAKRTTRLVAYLRVSTKGQEVSGLGLEAQQAAVEAYARSINATVVASFVETESGKRKDRPELTKALQAAKLMKATLCIATLSRLSRNLHFITSLMESGVDFVACDNPAATKLTIHILAAVAEEEARMISTRTKAALQAAKARGVKLGNPNGAAHLKGLSNAPAVAALRSRAVAQAMDLKATIEAMKAEGIVSLSGIARGLNERGILSATGGQWSPKTVSRVLERLEG